MHFQKEKVQNFINAFSHKKIHSNIHHLCIQKNHAFIKAFFQKKNLSNMHYICIKKKSFISAFFEKIMHSFIQTYIIYAFSKNKKSKIS